MHVCIRYIMERIRRISFAVARFVTVTVLLAAANALAQVADQSGLTPLPSAQSVINRNTDPYSGSIPQGTATSEVIDLTVIDALDRGLKYNLGLYLSNQSTAEARAARLQSLSNLLPNINGAFGEELQRINLKALGIKFAGFPSSVGPFGLTTLQATGSWQPLNATSIDRYRASGQDVKASAFNYNDARDTVVLAVGANYLLVIAQESRLEAVKAELQTAQALYQLAED